MTDFIDVLTTVSTSFILGKIEENAETFLTGDNQAKKRGQLCYNETSVNFNARDKTICLILKKRDCEQ